MNIWRRLAIRTLLDPILATILRGVSRHLRDPEDHNMLVAAFPVEQMLAEILLKQARTPPLFAVASRLR